MMKTISMGVNMDILQFIPEELMILVIGTYLMGIALKQAKFIKDNLIPIVLLSFAVVFSCLLQMTMSGLAMLQGILCWGVSVGINQTLKQVSKIE